MEFNDSYFTMLDEIIKNVESLRILHDDWLKPDSDKLDLSTKLKQSLRGIEWDLEDIQETVGIVENNPSRFNLSHKELAERQKFISDVQTMVEAVKQQLENGQKRGAITVPLFVPKPPGTVYAVNGDVSTVTKNDSVTIGDVETTIRESHTTRPTVLPVSDNHLFHQESIMRNQDERLAQLGASISTLKGMSRKIGDELGDHVALLDDFSGEMSHTESRLDAVTKRTARLLHLNTDRRQWWAIICLTLALIVILLLLAVL